MEWALLESLSEADRRAVLTQCRRQRYSRNEVVFREGEIGDCVHLLARGGAGVRLAARGGAVATLGVPPPGGAFGGRARVGDDDRRSATIVALERVETMRLMRDDFVQMLVDQPNTGRLLV